MQGEWILTGKEHKGDLQGAGNVFCLELGCQHIGVHKSKTFLSCALKMSVLHALYCLYDKPQFKKSKNLSAHVSHALPLNTATIMLEHPVWSVTCSTSGERCEGAVVQAAAELTPRGLGHRQGAASH